MSSKTSKKQAIDKNQLLTDKIIKLMEDGVKPWVKPWYSIGYQNLISGHQYRGVNPMLCAFDSMVYDYNSPYFVGLSAAKERGWIVKKGI
jgi:antirestriction protein ArdC